MASQPLSEDVPSHSPFLAWNTLLGSTGPRGAAGPAPQEGIGGDQLMPALSFSQHQPDTKPTSEEKLPQASKSHCALGTGHHPRGPCWVVLLRVGGRCSVARTGQWGVKARPVGVWVWTPETPHKMALQGSEPKT